MTRAFADSPHPQMVRTDFSDDGVWREITRRVTAPVGPERFLAYVDFTEDRSHDGLPVAEALTLARSGYRHSFIVLADRVSMSEAARPLLVIDLVAEPGRSFRAVPEAMQGIENNLSIANMDFAEFAAAADAAADGIFRGFVE